MTNEHLIELIRKYDPYSSCKPRDERVLTALGKVDRRDFLPDNQIALPTISYDMYRSLTEIHSQPGCKEDIDAGDLLNSIIPYIVRIRDLAYNDRPLAIGYGQSCSQPSLVAFIDDILELKQGMRVLEIGSGCGYHAAVTSHLIGELGFLFSVEIIPELAGIAGKNLEKHFGEGIEKRLKVIAGDGSIGLKEEAPFDRIYLTAGVDLVSFNPSVLAEQLKEDEGILLFPARRSQMLIKQRYSHGVMAVPEEKYEGIGFVPLMGKNS